MPNGRDANSVVGIIITIEWKELSRMHHLCGGGAGGAPGEALFLVTTAFTRAVFTEASPHVNPPRGVGRCAGAADDIPINLENARDLSLLFMVV